MDPTQHQDAQAGDESAAPELNGAGDDAATRRRRIQEIKESRRWWLKLLIQPALLLASGAILIIGLGVAQRSGWISAGGGSEPQHASLVDQAVQYICPMMCTPPQHEPGRCPVCAMELVPASSGGGAGGSRSIEIDPASRRVANIQTVAVKAAPVTRVIRAVGQLAYDEGALKTISAYVDGRLEKLYADYTGIEVNEGDRLALLYSPRLYSSQVELLVAKKALADGQSGTLKQVAQVNRNLYENAKQRLIELGMTPEQIVQIERQKEANSRMHLYAPISGTVIEKHAVEGDYVKEGQKIYRLADLSTVWLMLQLFPEDAAIICYGQKVEATVQSHPGKTFTGRVAFVDPNVDPETRTVGVRVVIPNPQGSLRVGDYAKASMEAPVGLDQHEGIYDPELADKWISPRHPHVVEPSPGSCSVCGVALVPAAKFGFTDRPAAEHESLVVPRDAVLMAGDNSVVYVETEPGRFEIRQVVLGPSSGNNIVVLKGIESGEKVATRGNFLIDSQMQLAGNPSLIDPTKAAPGALDLAPTEEVLAALGELPEHERALANQQRICPVTEAALGSMGAPSKVEVNGKTVFICCEGCRKGLLEKPEKYLARLEQAKLSATEATPEMDLPPIGLPEMILPDSDLPPISDPMEIVDQSDDAAAPTRVAEQTEGAAL